MTGIPDSGFNPQRKTMGDSGSIAEPPLQSVASVLRLTNNDDNRLITGTGGLGINAEGNLTFDGEILAITGSLTTSNEVTIGTDVTISGSDIILGMRQTALL